MKKKTLGFVELTWECPNCQTKNKGLDKNCLNCGGPQPTDIDFTLDENAKVIIKQEELEAVKQGADIHCPYCGTRNPQKATSCSQCGGDLVGGAKRIAGKVLAPKTCPTCGTVNGNAVKVCSKCGTKLESPAPITDQPNQSASLPVNGSPSGFRPWMMLPIIAGVLLLCSLVWLLFFKSTSVLGVVDAARWTRSIEIESFRDVKKQEWKDLIPAEGVIAECALKFRETSDQPTANSKEVCATKIVDQGNGAAEIVEECTYEVYDDYCTYTSKEWVVADKVTSQGNDLNPAWPTLSLSTDQREGNRAEQFEVVFDTSDGQKTYSTTDLDYFQIFTIGSEWMLSINTLGGIVEITR